MKTFGINATESDWWVKEIDDRFKNRESKDRCSLPLHRIVWEFKKNIEENRIGLGLEEMASLAEKISFFSQEKVAYYRSTRFGFIKQIFSFLRNIVCIGRFNSSGQLGLKLSHSFLSEYPVKKFQQPPLSPSKTHLIKEVLSLEKNEIKIANHDKDQPKTLSQKVEQGDVIEEVLTSEYLEMMIHANSKNADYKYADAIDDETLDELIKQGTIQYILDWEQIGEVEEIKDNFEADDDDDVFYDAREFFDSPTDENLKANILSPIVSTLNNEKNVLIPAKDSTPKIDADEKENLSTDEISIPNHSLKAPPLELKPVLLTAKDEMLTSVKMIWKYASQFECQCIQLILATIMKSAEIDQWKATDKDNEYQLDLKHELLGKSAQLLIGKIVIKQKMKVAFSEERNPETERYRQVITFPDKGICCRMGVGWFSKDIPVNRIVVEEKRNQVWCSVEAMGKKTPERSADFILSFLYDLDWG
jgi:hypothetical protein